MHTTTLPWSVIWAIVNQALAGLAHAHARGVIHGDLKPSNLMLDLASTSRGPRVYILDLGLAWLRQQRHDSRLDGSPAPELALHAGAGTVGWVAPEQIRKLAPHVGPPTDLYALGCIVYRILTGKEVFEGNAQDVLRAHKRRAVVPPPKPARRACRWASTPYVVRLLGEEAVAAVGVRGGRAAGVDGLPALARADARGDGRGAHHVAPTGDVAARGRRGGAVARRRDHVDAPLADDRARRGATRSS